MSKLLLLLISLFLFNPAFAETIRFVPLPTQPRDVLIGNHIALVEYLKKRTNLDIELKYVEDYNKLIKEFVEGKIHIVTSGPLPYTVLKNQFPDASAIMHFREKDGSYSYSCVLVTSIDGPKRIRDIKGPIALTQKLSTCGYFSANIILSKHGKNIDKLGYTHFNSHNEVIENVIRGKYEAGSLKKDIAEQYRGFAIRILDESPSWPSFSVIVNRRVLDERKIKLIKEALLSIDKETGKGLIAGRYGFVEAKEENFEIIKKYEKYKPKF